jgi:hypothetical protein
MYNLYLPKVSLSFAGFVLVSNVRFVFGNYLIRLRRIAHKCLTSLIGYTSQYNIIHQRSGKSREAGVIKQAKGVHTKGNMQQEAVLLPQISLKSSMEDGVEEAIIDAYKQP